jgi:Leucine-rich repeat (LRR) protein
MTLDISNRGIKSLKDYFKEHSCPPNITILDCSSNELTSLYGCPESVVTLFCMKNNLTCLEGCPSGVEYLYCSNNKLKSIYGCPENVLILECNDNELKSLDFISKKIIELYCSNRDWNGGNKISYLPKMPNLKVLCCNYLGLKSLYGLPFSVDLVDASYNNLVSLAGINNNVNFYYDSKNFKQWPKTQRELAVYNTFCKLHDIIKPFKKVYGELLLFI